KRSLTNNRFEGGFRSESRSRRHGPQLRNLASGNRNQKATSGFDLTEDARAVVPELSNGNPHWPRAGWIRCERSNDFPRLAMLRVVFVAQLLGLGVRNAELLLDQCIGEAFFSELERSSFDVARRFFHGCYLS